EGQDALEQPLLDRRRRRKVFLTPTRLHGGLPILEKSAETEAKVLFKDRFQGLLLFDVFQETEKGLPSGGFAQINNNGMDLGDKPRYIDEVLRLIPSQESSAESLELRIK